MKIVKPSVEILSPINGEEILRLIEKIGRVCYKSEDKITEDSAKKFVSMIIKNGHEAIIEHFNISVKFITDRGISHEIVRHRIASYAQESSRYCNYSNSKFGNELSFVKPADIKEDTYVYETWELACKDAESDYLNLVNCGIQPQIARSILPTCLKTEIVMTTNLREWRHFLKLRTSKAAHPDIRRLAIDLLNQLKSLIPIVFDDIEMEE
jgi:thymidylate synthase (FAD)